MYTVLILFAALVAFATGAPVSQNTTNIARKYEPIWSNPKRCPPFPVSPCDYCEEMEEHWKGECFTYCIDPSYWPKECSLDNRHVPYRPLNDHCARSTKIENGSDVTSILGLEPKQDGPATQKPTLEARDKDITSLFPPSIDQRVDRLVYLMKDLSRTHGYIRGMYLPAKDDSSYPWPSESFVDSYLATWLAMWDTMWPDDMLESTEFKLKELVNHVISQRNEGSQFWAERFRVMVAKQVRSEMDSMVEEWDADEDTRNTLIMVVNKVWEKNFAA